MTKLLVEGWRFIPNSFAIVNQFQCLELLHRKDIELRHRDIPYWNPHWKSESGLLPPDLEQELRSLPGPPPGETADITLRMGCPFDFSPSDSSRTVVFATCEFGIVAKEAVAGRTSVGEALVESDTTIITPSTWSKAGLINSGAPEQCIKVVSHGVDTDIFHPLPASERRTLRRSLGWENSFVFLNVGAMTSNKGIDRALKAVLQLSKAQPRIRLMLKGIDALYPSGKHLSDLTQRLSETDLHTLQQSVGYIGGSQSFRELSRYYQAADAYLSPYLAEGFNLPVLEAMACGLPVICTGGGATDDFTSPDFTLSINSTLKTHSTNGTSFLEPDQAHLVSVMQKIIEDIEWRSAASQAAAAYAKDNLTWKHVVDHLLDVLLEHER